ncbi:hypothetical protein DM02DRAFT_670980 [Periconia macrospinosa]|uniref:Pentatricopeptide repeat-containing protein-mitochondrial domain-containing protein n=1 Tax=Periconia macrospinosa TaxID=97972 RepID=A0A2V1DUE6_9PLEO|nr:hypothetical protein DM02DRAFT_670980 [Periconia macrospinosa]
MPPRPFINDALWRCLCPRFSQTSTLAPAGSATRNRTLQCKPPTKTSKPHSREYSTSSQASDHPFASWNISPNSPNTIPRFPPTNPRRSLKQEVPLVQLPTPELYERLRIDGAAGKFDDVMSIIRILIKDRREVPNSYMYTAVLHSFASCDNGTGGKIRKVLEEMRESGVDLDGRGAECVLEALAVHPDHLLRTEILDYMRERWFNLSDRAHNFVVAGQMRERLFEQALEGLENMVKERIKVESWLWDMIIWLLLEYKEPEETFYVLRLRQSVEGYGAKLSNVMWLQLLEAASKRHLAEGVSMVWDTQVVPGYIKPPTGTCLNVLSVASRSGNVKLATDVFRVLTERGTVFTSHHYEALIECYLTAQDLPAALSVILIMHDSGLRVTVDSLNPLYAHLSVDPSLPFQAFRLLQEQAAAGKKIPIAAVNTCIQACIPRRNAVRLSEAIEIYKALHTVCPGGPNTDTFNLLFQGCQRTSRKELAMYFTGEMLKLGVKPNRITYDRLILVCAQTGDIEDALLYYEEMRGMGWVPRPRTFEVLITESVEKKDERAVAVTRDYGEIGGAGAGKLAYFKKLVAKKFEERIVGDPSGGR